MSNYQYENYRYTEELCRVENQSVVECRFPGAEMATVLAVQARVVESECVCVDGEVKYNGKLLLGVVYEDGNKMVCRAERGAEFFHKATHGEISPACFAKGNFTAQSVSHRREGASTYVSVVIGASISVYRQAAAEYLEGGEGIVVKKQAQSIAQVSAAKGEIEETDDFYAEEVVDVLLHEEWARVISCKAKTGEIEIEGEICYDVCALKADGGVIRCERFLPVRMSLPCEESREEDGVKAGLEVRRAEVSVTAYEGENRAKISFTCGIYADCTLYKKSIVTMGTDAFSPTKKLHLTRKKVAGRYLTEQKNYDLRVAGTAAASFVEKGWTLLCAFLPSVELNPKEKTLEGVLDAHALLKNEEGGYRISKLSLPFSLDVGVKKGEEIDCCVSGLNVRNFGEESTQLEGTLKLGVYTYQQAEAEYVTQVEDGEAIPQKTCAFTLFLPKKGDELWEVAKKMGVSPEEVERTNPTVKFPVEEDVKIVVYRQKV